MDGDSGGKPSPTEKALEEPLTTTIGEQVSSQSPDVEKEKVKGTESGPVNIPETTDADAAFAHLPEHEKQILKKQLDAPTVRINFLGLYRYASKMDLLIIFISAICAIAGGAALPLFTVCL